MTLRRFRKSALALLCSSIPLLWVCCHTPLYAANFDFPEAVRLAWKIDPIRLNLLTNQHSADARADAANSLFPSGPILSGEYFSDKVLGSRQGYATWQGGISVPLWLPGQSEATVRVAQTESEALQERLNVEHMSLAVKVLDTAGAVFIARRKQMHALSLLRTIKNISETITTMVKTGEAPSTDKDAIDAEVAAAKSAVEMANEELAVTSASLAEILGSKKVPDISSYDAKMLQRSRLNASHLDADKDPRVRAAHLAVINAQENLHLAQKSFMPNPQIGIAAIRDIQFGSPWDTRTAITLNVPLPSEAQNVPLKTAAIDKLATAEKEEQMARRMVRVEFAQVVARQKAAEATLANARTATASLNKRADDIEQSWKLKESSLIEVLRAHQSAYNARLTLAQAEVALHAAVIRFFIAAGRVY